MSQEITIKLPYQSKLRWYQKEMWECLDYFKRGYFLVHRRAGKDFVSFNILIREAAKKKGIYYYLFPTYEQARKVVWEGITNDGRTFHDFIPPDFLVKKNEQQMSWELGNGSIIRLIGTDRYDAVRGTNPIGCVFSEFAFQNPMAWDVIRPILRANDGWAIFITTANGENHAYELWENVVDNDNWLTQILTIDDTRLLTEHDLEEERASGMSEAMIRQEYYLDFNALSQSIVYSRELQEAEERIGFVPYDPLLPVQTFWDLGRADAVAVWFAQVDKEKIKLIDYYENVGTWTADWIKLLKEKNYTYEPLGLPHDAYNKVKEAENSVAEQFELAGFNTKRIPKTSIVNGISAVRRVFPRLMFDKEKCAVGLRTLKNYQYEYDVNKKMLKNTPMHNFASHCADALRYLAVGIEEQKKKKVKTGMNSVEYKQFGSKQRPKTLAGAF